LLVPPAKAEHSGGLPRTGGDVLEAPFPRDGPEEYISISDGPSDTVCSGFAVDEGLWEFAWSGLTDFVDNARLLLTAAVLVSLGGGLVRYQELVMRSFV
jgi:hypothetical protein